MHMAQLAGSETSEILDIEDLDPAQWNEFACNEGWSDGLPLIPPTEALVDEFLRACRGDDEPLRPLSPRLVTPTLRSAAANAVMAGCKPQYFPVVLAALRAISVPGYNLHGTLATTHPCGPTIMIGGPIRHDLSVNCATNCFGQGSRPNATIGRALALIIRNVGGGVPGATDRATQGSPAKYTFCFGENEEECPWEPYRVRRGFAREESVVTVFATEPPHNINDHASDNGASLLTTVASVMSQSGSNSMYGDGPTLLVFSPEHAQTLHRDGWTIEAIQHRVFDLARIPTLQVSVENQEAFGRSGRRPEHGGYSITPKPEDIHIVVAGGAGKHSAWIPSFGATELSCVRVKPPRGDAS